MSNPFRDALKEYIREDIEEQFDQMFDVDEPQVGSNDPCYANTPYCLCLERVRGGKLGERCADCNGLL